MHIRNRTMDEIGEPRDTEDEPRELIAGRLPLQPSRRAQRGTPGGLHRDQPRGRGECGVFPARRLYLPY